MKFAKILVPVNGSPGDDEAVELACALAKRYKSKVYALYVIEVKQVLPLDATLPQEATQGERILERVEDLGDQFDVPIEGELVQARSPGAAIVDEAFDRGIDLIVMSVKYRRRLGEFTMGRTVPYVLKNAKCRVVVLRIPVEG